jgi:hypothetical protein
MADQGVQNRLAEDELGHERRSRGCAEGRHDCRRLHPASREELQPEKERFRMENGRVREKVAGWEGRSRMPYRKSRIWSGDWRAANRGSSTPPILLVTMVAAPGAGGNLSGSGGAVTLGADAEQR